MRKYIKLAYVKKSSSEVIKAWFNMLKQIMNEENISWENVYNADESGFGVGKKRMICVIIDISLKEAYQAEFDWQEWVIIMEYIYADGIFIPSLIIFKGVNLYKD